MATPQAHDDYVIVAFGEAVRLRRLQLGFTQESLGERLTVGQSAISKVEASPTPPKDSLFVAQMAEVLDLPVDDLRAGRIPRPKAPAHRDSVEELIRRLARVYGGASNERRLRKLLENYRALDEVSADKLVQESDWLRQISERSGTGRPNEREEPYQAEG